jgi:hypothetical protein
MHPLVITALAELHRRDPERAATRHVAERHPRIRRPKRRRTR